MLDIWTIAQKHPHPAAPLITWIAADDGARIELSTSTALNHMAKIANACADELDIEVGTHVFVDISWHWQLPMWLGGLWAAGAQVVTDVRTAEVVIADEKRAHTYSTSGPCYAVSLHPFGLDITATLPTTCIDATHIVRAQPDALMYPQNFSDALALDEWDQHRILESANLLVEEHSIAPYARVLATAAAVPINEQFLVALPLPLSCQGSLVMCESADQTLIDSERVTHVWA